jgi:hypothetical protein
VKNQEPDQRAVDADTSQILADLQLKAIDKDGGVPIVDHRGDIGPISARRGSTVRSANSLSRRLILARRGASSSSHRPAARRMPQPVG